MQNEIIINADPGETRVAILERSNFSELHIERSGEQNVAGNVVMGRVTRVLPGMHAAFVDIGLEKAAFLYAGDYLDTTHQREGDNGGSSRRRRGNGRSPGQIEKMLHEGKEIVVQIAKEPIGTKGARITSQISIPGRHLVLTPWSSRVGVSRRIGSDRERRRLRETVEKLRPKDLGFIIRTAGDGVRDADLEADIRYLASVWKGIQQRVTNARAPVVLYSEPDLPLRMIRDFTGPETKRIAVDAEAVYQSMREFVDQFVADPKPRIEHYQGEQPIFDHFDLELQIQANLERRVRLKSGGYLIIDQSEALTSIDVNTGRYVGKRNLEETVLKTNLEAVKEIVHQLRFRNIGGIVIMDLIDMESAGNRDKVFRALREALRQDKARTNILKISELGLVEMTRKRTRENLVQTLCEPCSYCEGRGYVLSSHSVAFNILREIRKDLPRFGGRHIAITVAPSVAEALLHQDSQAMRELSERLGREIEVRARPGLHQEQFEVTALDRGEPVNIALRWLGDQPEDSETTQIAAADSSEDATADDPTTSQSEPVSETETDGPGAEPNVSVSEHSPAGDPLPEELPSEDPLVAVSEQAGLAPPDETDDEAAETTEPLDDAAESPILRPFPEREGT